MAGLQSTDHILTCLEKLVSVRGVSKNNQAFSDYQGMELHIDNLVIRKLRDFGYAYAVQRGVPLMEMLTLLDRAVKVKSLLWTR